MAQVDLANSLQGTRLNAFPLIFTTGAAVHYRVWTIDPIPHTSELREKIRSFLWQKALRRPVFPMYRDNAFVFGVAGWHGENPVQYAGDGERRFTISPTDDRRSVSLSEAQGTEAELAAAILQYELVLHLRNDQRLTRGHNATDF